MEESRNDAANKTIIAIARMMMVYIYHIVSEKQPFNPTEYEELMEPYVNQPKVILNDTTVFAYLTSKGTILLY